MPKMKTRKAVAARFKVTGTGKLLRRRMNKRHLMTAKSAKRRMRLSRPSLVPSGLLKTYKRLMGV